MPETATLSVRSFNNRVKPTWCPGCGDFGILSALKAALAELQIHPHEVVVVGGIGCGSKLPDYMRCYGFMTIHGRPLAVATGIRLANPGLHVVVVNGDGDNYGIGGNHFLHACRRNLDIAHIVENNQIYALTKGQYSPTSDPGFRTTTSPQGVIESPVLPLVLAIGQGATFVARGFAGEPRHLAELFAAAIRHRGYALVDVLQPCVTFNKVNTYDWYAERVYRLEDEPGYDPTDFAAALERAYQWGDRIPIGVLWRNEGRPTYEEQVPGLRRGVAPAARPLAPLDRKAFERLKEAYV